MKLSHKILYSGITVIAVALLLIFITNNSNDFKTIPNPKTANPKEIIKYLASETFNKKSLRDKHDYLIKFLYARNTLQQQQTAINSVNKLSDDEIRKIRNNIVDAIKFEFIEQAKIYNQLSGTNKRKYIQQQLQNFAVLQRWADTARKSDKIKRNTPAWTEKGAFELFMSRTSPIEQAALETYLSDIAKAYFINEAQKRLSRRRYR